MLGLPHLFLSPRYWLPVPKRGDTGVGCCRLLFGLGEGMGKAKCGVLMLLCWLHPNLILRDVGAACWQSSTELCLSPGIKCR